MQLRKPKRLTLSSQIVSEMQQCIEDGIWPIGCKIPSETVLSQEFDVGRSTIREAIFSLVQAGLLESKRGGGSYVISNSRFNAAVQNELHATQISDILETRLILETAIVRFVCERGSEEELKTIESLFFSRKDSKNKTKEELHNIDRLFHMQIAAASHNELLHSLYSSFYSFLDKSFTLFEATSEDPLLIDAHEHLYLGLINRDSQKAQEAIHTLIDIIRNTFKEASILD